MNLHFMHRRFMRCALWRPVLDWWHGREQRTHTGPKGLRARAESGHGHVRDPVWLTPVQIFPQLWRTTTHTHTQFMLAPQQVDRNN